MTDINLNDLILLVLLIVIGHKINNMTKHTYFFIKLAYNIIIILIFYKFISNNKISISDLLFDFSVLLLLLADRRTYQTGSNMNEKCKIANHGIIRLFGEKTTIVTQGASYEVEGILQSPVGMTDMGGTKVMIANRTIQFIEKDFIHIQAQAGDQCIVRGVTYTLVNPHPDGYGMIEAELRDYTP